MSAVDAGTQAAQSGDLVTFGIKPTHAEIGYGYLDGPTRSCGPRMRSFIRYEDVYARG